MEDDFRIIAQCPDVERLYQAIETFRGSILIFASALKPDLSFMMERLRLAQSRALAVAEHGESAQPFISAGVQGMLYRSVSGPTLIDVTRRVAEGETWVQPSLGVPGTQEDEDMVGARVRDRLTPKEMKIVALIVQGCKNKEIAMRLGTTEQVIKNYLRSVYDKTGVSDRLELALFTIHHRILAEAAAAAGNLMMQS